MVGSKEMFLRMRQADYNNLPGDIRELFTYTEVREENEYQTHKDDPVYREFYKAKKKASKELQDYLFDKRHGKN